MIPTPVPLEADAGTATCDEHAMRCYFHLVSQHECLRDDEGIDVSDIETARRQALQAIHELRQESDDFEEDWRDWQLDIADSEGHVLLSIPLIMSRQ